ncbi:MAG: potassium transporter Kup [Acidobacteriota bacterium]
MSHAEKKSTHTSPLALLALSALGVVYGDIGTSPLYALRECFHGAHAVLPTRENVFGVLSLVVWSLIIIVTLKYHVYVIRFDNEGEGGILALMALVRTDPQRKKKRSWTLLALGLFGAALLYGDGIITPAISVLSAVEGLEVATAVFKPYVVAITLVILIVLFLFQRRGTGGVGAVFGPVMTLWFMTLAVLGVLGITHDPTVLFAVNPLYAVRFFLANGLHGFLVLGAVFLVATGGEALYADLGHFGERPIQIDWFGMVAPALLLNYFGQGALLIRHPEATVNPFYRLAPSWALYPLVALATAATVIASQAIISGAFSLTRQAVQLGYLPRVNIVHTSSGEIGQIYIPTVNWLLMVATIGLVLGFRASTNLASAYGIAVTTTMVITTVLAYFVSRQRGWPTWLAALVTAGFLAVDTAFFGANIVKVLQGGWVPLLVAAFIYLLMTTWKRGRQILGDRLAQNVLPVEPFLADVARRKPARVAGTALFLNSDRGGTPIALLHNLKHNRVLHEKNVFLTVITEEVPHVPEENRLEILPLAPELGFWRAVVRYGFFQDPDVPTALMQAKEKGLDLDPWMATYFLSRNSLLASDKPGMARWRENLFIFMSRNASRPTQFFRLPPNRVVELGMQVEI